jgi:hypothetical protein
VHFLRSIKNSPPHVTDGMDETTGMQDFGTLSSPDLLCSEAWNVKLAPERANDSFSKWLVSG